MNYHARESGERWLQPVPDPPTDVLAGRILKSFYIVQEPVVKSIMDRRECFLYISVVNHPTTLCVNGADDVDFYAYRVTVQALAFVPNRRLG
jgi:hypothetical protein